MDKSHTVAQLVTALLANSKVPGSSPGGVTDDYFFLSYISGSCEEEEEEAVTSDFHEVLALDTHLRRHELR